jgi:hypothetical protein
MFRGMGKKSAVAGFALLAASAFGGAANAADLGGGCCADLEERVAELEATTARKGNRVVSLEVSGQVNQAILAWDNGVDSDTYVVTPTGSTLLRFRGEGKISEEMKAGYYMELALYGEGVFLTDQNSDEAAGNFTDGVALQHNALFLDHVKLGRLWIGQTSGATDNITNINVANSLGVRSSGVQLVNGDFTVQGTSGAAVGIKYKDLFGGDATQAIGEGHRYDLVKYESPSIAGFKFSVAAGEDDFWDAALRYAGLLGGRFKVAAGIGYGSFGQGDDNGCADEATGLNLGSVGRNREADCHQIGASLGVMDMGTGLFVHFAYGLRTDEVVEDAGLDGERERFYTQAGIEKNWFGVGATTLFGEYEKSNMGNYAAAIFNADGTIAATPAFADAEATVWGLGVVQKFDAAALDLYLTYRNISAEVNGDDVEDWSEIYAGAKIAF